MSSRTPPTGLSELVVTIVGTSESSGHIMVRDSLGNEKEVDGSVRHKGGGYPVPGERWIIVKRGNVWVPDMMVGAPPRPVVSGARVGLHPVMGQVLDVLATLGMVDDQTR